MNLPDGWSDSRLDQVADVILGQSPPGSSYNIEGAGVPFFQGKGEFGAIRPAISKWTTDPKKLATTDDVLLSVRAPVGPTNLAPCDCSVGRGLAAIHPLGDIDPRYILWGLRATTDALAGQATGTTFGAVSGSQVRSHRLPIAPLAEQWRIVAVIEEQFSHLDAAGESLQRARRRLEVLRVRVAEAAFASDWSWALTGELAEVQGGIQKQPRRRPVENKAPFLRVANVPRGRLDLTDVHEIELFDGELERYRLLPGDLLVVEGNGSVEQIGRAATWCGEIADCVHQNHLIRVRPGPELLPDFLGAYWNAPSTRRRLADVASSTSGLYTLSTAKVKAVPLPIVPLDEQRQIVANLQRQLSLIDSQSAAIETAARRGTALRRSILEQAFSGRLVPQDPTDEPASALLERIAAARARSAGATGKRPRRRGTMERS